MKCYCTSCITNVFVKRQSKMAFLVNAGCGPHCTFEKQSQSVSSLILKKGLKRKGGGNYPASNT